MLGKDGIAGLAVAAASLALFSLTLGLQKSALVPIGPGFYPRIVLGLAAALGLALAARDFFARRRRGRPPPSPEKANYLLVAAAFGAFALYIAALPLLGFRLATFAFVAGLNLLLAPPKAPRDWARAALLAAAAAIATWLAFERYLQVLLPRGTWTGL